MGTENLNKILNLIRDSYQEEKIDKEDLIAVARFALLLDDIDSLPHLSDKFFQSMMILDPDPLDPVYGHKFRTEFSRHAYLKQHKTLKRITQVDIQNYYEKQQDMPVFFGVTDGKLDILIGNDNGSFKNSQIKQDFDRYSVEMKANYKTPEQILIPFNDLKEIMTFLNTRISPEVYLETVVSLSNDVDKRHRVVVMVSCNASGAQAQLYDTFQLNPPY